MRSEYCLAGDYGFAKDKGDRWMTEESYVDTRVREFADYIDCDPELAQKLYFQNDVPSTLDNEQKASMFVSKRNKLRQSDVRFRMSYSTAIGFPRLQLAHNCVNYSRCFSEIQACVLCDAWAEALISAIL